MTSLYDPHELGYKCAAKISTKWRKLKKKRANHIKEINLKDWCLKFGTMKKEFRVIVDK